MTDLKPTQEIRGEIVLLDAQNQETRQPIANCLEIIAPDGNKFAPDYDGKGGFSAVLTQAGQYHLQATIEDEQLIFAFNRSIDPNRAPETEIAVQVGEKDIRLFAWVPIRAAFGHDPKVDTQFARDTAKGCIALHDSMIAEGKSEAEAWEEIRRVLETAFASSLVPNLLCKTCMDRYYTPGTPYYMNYPAYDTCMRRPPCT